MAATDAKRQSRLYINPANVKDTGILTADNNIGLPDFSGSGIIPDSNVQADIEQLKNAGIQQMEANSPACMQDYFQVIQGFALSGMKGPSAWHSDWLYHRGGLALSNDNKLYVSIKDQNKNHPLTNTSYWVPVDGYVEPNFYAFVGSWNEAGDTLTLSPSTSDAPTITTGQNNVPLINGQPIPTGTRFSWHINKGTNAFADWFNLVFQDFNGNTTYADNSMRLTQWREYFTPPNSITGTKVVFFYTNRFVVDDVHPYAYHVINSFPSVIGTVVIDRQYLFDGRIYAKEKLVLNASQFGANDVKDYTTSLNFTQYISVSGTGVDRGFIIFGNPDPNNNTGLLNTALDPSTHVIRFRCIIQDGGGEDWAARDCFITIEGFISE